MALDDRNGSDIPQDEGPPPAAPPKKRRGFAAMDRSAVRALARKGGVAAHRKGTAHRFNSDEARLAGKKGGLAPHRKRGTGSRRERGNDVEGPAKPAPDSAGAEARE